MSIPGPTSPLGAANRRWSALLPEAGALPRPGLCWFVGLWSRFVGERALVGGPPEVGVHFRIRLEEDRLCALVMIGVGADGSKQLLACADGYRESAESWAEVLRDLRDRGIGAPAVAVGDGRWDSGRRSATREQRCWVHKIANILNALPKRLHRSAKAALHEIYKAETRTDAESGIDRFARDYGDKYPKAVAKLTKDRDTLLAFFDFPAAHWVHLRTANPIESTFATVRLRTRVTKGAGTRNRGLVMAYKLLDAAQDRWRRINSPELVPWSEPASHSKTVSNSKGATTNQGTPPDPDPQHLTISPFVREQMLVGAPPVGWGPTSPPAVVIP